MLAKNEKGRRNVLLIHGDKDVFVALVEGAGHLVPFTHSKQVAKLIQHHMCCL